MPKTKAMKDAEAKAIVDAERKKKDEEARAAKEARLKVGKIATNFYLLFNVLVVPMGSYFTSSQSDQDTYLLKSDYRLSGMSLPKWLLVVFV